MRAAPSCAGSQLDSATRSGHALGFHPSELCPALVSGSAHLRQISVVNPVLHAAVEVQDERALEDAAAADGTLDQNPTKPGVATGSSSEPDILSRGRFHPYFLEFPIAMRAGA